MLSILDQVVADWGFKTWYLSGEPVTQVRVLLFNGMILMMNFDDFIEIINNEEY